MIKDKHQPWENSHQKHKRREKGLSKAKIIQGMVDGTIPSAISDTGASSAAGKPTDPFVSTNEISTKVFGLPTGGTALSATVAKLHFNIRDPVNRVDIVPTLETNLLSGSKFSDAGYIAVYNVNEVNFYEKSAIAITEKAVLHGDLQVR